MNNKERELEEMAGLVALLFGYTYAKCPERRSLWNFWRPTKPELRAKAIEIQKLIKERKERDHV